ncbi:MAG: CPBP family intramembrane glutamic endopeptidase [Bacteroidota bacterium]
MELLGLGSSYLSLSTFTHMHLLDHILIFCLLVLLPARSLWAGRQAGGGLPASFTHEAKMVLYYGNSALLWMLAAAVGLVCWFYGRPAREIGLQWGETPYSGMAQALVLLFLVLYILDVFAEVGKLSKKEVERAKAIPTLPAFLPSTGREFIHYSFLALSAGLAEEIVYRGYCISYLQAIIGDEDWWQLALILLLPALAFGMGHIYQGWQAVVKIVIMATLFGAIFWLSSSLWVLMLLHVAVDLVGGLLGWNILRDKPV